MGAISHFRALVCPLRVDCEGVVANLELGRLIQDSAHVAEAQRPRLTNSAHPRERLGLCDKQREQLRGGKR